MLEETYDLKALARQLMIEKGLKPDFSAAVQEQLATLDISRQAKSTQSDLRSLAWCSIDNDDSLDLDQLSYGQILANGDMALWVAIADVESLVPQASAIDEHAANNTTTVYTSAKIFPMLPAQLSTDLTSLKENADRSAFVIKMVFDPQGQLQESSLSSALVHNYAKLTYSEVGDWLDGLTATISKKDHHPDLITSLRSQHQTAQILKQKRRAEGSLVLQNLSTEAKVTHSDHVALARSFYNSANELIENCMVAANTAVATYFKEALLPALKRVVRVPKKWNRITALALQLGYHLPESPDAKALSLFLAERKKTDPQNFGDLSLAILKLLGPGEYVCELPQADPIGHFGLGLAQYMHFTAPNRRFADLISQRQYKSHYQQLSSPYSFEQLQQLADHCTRQEDAAAKVERSLNKSAIAMALSQQIGKEFTGIITGASPKGTWVRISNPIIEGKVIHGYDNLDVGDKVQVKLVDTDIIKGYIDFVVKK